jgi:hypothetical protein
MTRHLAIPSWLFFLTVVGLLWSVAYVTVPSFVECLPTLVFCSLLALVLWGLVRDVGQMD